MSIALWLTQVLLAALFGHAGFFKTFQTQKAKETFHAEDRSDAFVRFVGISELLGALGMLLPMSTRVLPWLTVLAAMGLP